MKTVLGLFVILLVVVGAIFYVQKYGTTFPSFLAQKTVNATIKDHRLKLIVAKTNKEKEIGLSEKSSLDKDKGMLFLFDTPGYYSFWMKNMKLPIDIIFVNNNKIVTIHSNVTPAALGIKDEIIPIYKPEEPADKVIEINAGLSETYGFQKGDEVKIEGL